MSQVTGFPAASQEFCQIALSFSKIICSLVADNSLSKGLAVTSISLFSLKRFAVSLTRAKASGIISSKTFSEIEYASSFNASTSV